MCCSALLTSLCCHSEGSWVWNQLPQPEKVLLTKGAEMGHAEMTSLLTEIQALIFKEILPKAVNKTKTKKETSSPFADLYN